MLAAFGLVGCQSVPPSTEVEPIVAPTTAEASALPSSTPTAQITTQPTATATQTATPTPTATPIVVGDYELIPLDLPGSDELVEGELTLLNEIEIPPSAFYDPVFRTDSSELLYRYGLALRRVDLPSNQYVGEISPSFETNLGDMVLSPDGDYAVIADGRDLVILDLGNGQIEHRFEATDEYIFGMQFLPSGELFLSVDSRGAMTLRDPKTWEVLAQFQDPAQSLVQRLDPRPQFLSDGSRIVMEGVSGFAEVLDLEGNLVDEVYIGARGEVQLDDGQGATITLGQNMDLMVLDSQRTPFAGIRIETRDCYDPSTPFRVLAILNHLGERIRCQYLLASGDYRVHDLQGDLLGTVEVRARRLTFTSASGELLAVLRIDFFQSGPISIEVLNDEDETVEQLYLDQGTFLSVLLDQRSILAYAGRELLCIDIETGNVSCSVPLEDVSNLFARSADSIPDGYWLAVDSDRRLRVFDLVQGRETFRSRPLEFYNIKGVALSPNRAVIALIINKFDTRNSFLQIWGYVGS